MEELKQQGERSLLRSLLRMIAICGEVPRSDTSWLGSSAAVNVMLSRYKGLVRVSGAANRLKMKQETDMAEQITKKRKTGEWETNVKTIRGSLQKQLDGAPAILSELESISPRAREMWEDNFRGMKLGGNIEKIYRNHKTARTLMILDAAGIGIEPWSRPFLPGGGEIVDNQFYTTREVRQCMEKTMQKEYKAVQTMGFLTYPDKTYMTYFFFALPAKRNDEPESRMRFVFEELAQGRSKTIRWNPTKLDCKDVLLIIQSDQVGFDYLKNEKEERPWFSSKIRDVHYVPNSPDGSKLLQIWRYPNWEEKIAEKLFEPSMRVIGSRDLHAKIGNNFATMWFDGNLSLLKTIRRNARNNPQEKYVIFCFDCQAEFLKMSGYFSKCSNTIIKPVSVEVGISMITWEERKEEGHESRATNADETMAH